VKYDLLYYVMTNGCYNASFLQLKTFLLNTVSRKVSAVGNTQSIEVSVTNLVDQDSITSLQIR